VILHLAEVVGAGFLVGAASGILGVGGGIFLVPIMTIAFGLPQRVAQGTSLATILPTAVVGAAAHDRQGNVLRRAALLIGAGGAVGAVFGAVVALYLPHVVLARAFGVLLLLAALRTWPAWKRPTPEEAGR
jgi:uncharacterized membrane protein YfcA